MSSGVTLSRTSSVGSSMSKLGSVSGDMADGHGSVSSAAQLCTLLISKLQWSAPKLASRLHVPVIVVEECVRTGRASALLRTQLVHWIRESGEVPPVIPPVLVAAVLHDDPTATNVIDEEGDIDDFCGLDTVTQAHFRFLRQSVGHNFVSVLNDPGEIERKKDWGEWLGAAVYDAFDAGPAAESEASGDRAAEVLRNMLSQHEVSRESFTPYLEYIGEVYRENRAVKEAQRGAFTLGGQSMEVESIEDIPFPTAVPQEFFEEGFDVRKVLESLGDDDSVVALMGEQLQAQHDEVEECLMLHVHFRSQQFFNASKIFDRLHTDVGHAQREIRSARGDVIRCGEDLVDQFMRIARLHRRRAALKCILDVTSGVGDLTKEVRSVQRAMAEQRYIDAATHVEAAMVALDSNGGQIAELRALHNYPMHIGEVRKNLLLVLLSEADTKLHHSQWESTSDWSVVSEVLQAAEKLGCLGGCLQQYRTGATDGVWSAMRSTIVSTLLSLNAVSNEALDVAMTAATSPSAGPEEKQRFLQCLKKVKAQHYVEVISRSLDAMASFVSKAIAHAEAVEACLEKHDVNGDVQSSGAHQQDSGWSSYAPSLYLAVQSSVVSLLECRADENANLRLHEMESIMRMSFEFINGAETLLRKQQQQAGSSAQEEGASSPKTTSNSSLGSFKAQLLTQARAFFRRQHDKQQQKLLMMLSQEQWVPEESVEFMFQHYCDSLCQSDDKAQRQAKLLSVNYISMEGSNAPRPTLPPDTGFAQYLTVGSENAFCVANSILMLLQSLHEYDRYLCTFPFLASDIVMRIHDAIKLYDGQCAVLVLGAGAVDQGILQSVSVSHLALGSQCISFLVQFTPLLRQRMIAITPPKAHSFVQCLDRVEKDLLEHRDEFYAKMIAMARQQLDSIEFDPQQWQAEGHGYIMKVLREAARLIKALKPVFGTQQTAHKCVMLPVLYHITGLLREHVKRAPLYIPACATKVWQDLQIFIANVQKFGYSVLQVASVATISEAASAELRPTSDDTEDALKQLFLPA